VFTAAMQLKWNPLDPLMNRRDLFPFEKTYYFPRPDHEPEQETVSLAWAGAKSENLATVWLLYHLTDHLNLGEFRQVTRLLGLDRKEGESYLEYKRRIRDKKGVVVNREALFEAAFERSKQEVEPDIIFSGKERMLETVHRLHYRIPQKASDKLGMEREQILRYDFTRLKRLNGTMKHQWTELATMLQNPDDMTSVTKEFLLLRHFYWVQNDAGKHDRMVYTENPNGIPYTVLLPVQPQEMVGIDSLPKMENIWVDDLLTSGTIDELQRNLNRSYKNIKNDHLIINLFSFSEITSNDILEFLQLSNTHRAANKSFVLVTNKVEYDQVPDEICLVPTVQEAKDIIEMEEIERDLDL